MNTSGHQIGHQCQKRAALPSQRRLGEIESPTSKLQKRKKGIRYIPMMITSLMTFMHNARRKLQSRSETAMRCKKYLLNNVSNPKKDDLERGEKLLANELVWNSKDRVQFFRAQFMITKKQRLRHQDLALKTAKAENTKIILQTEVMFL